MDWSRSYNSMWRVFRVNRRTWADAERLPNVIGADVLKTSDGDTLESGELEVTGDFSPDYYRIVMTAEQGGEVKRVDVATLLFLESGGDHDYGVDAVSINGYSVLYPASVKVITVGAFAPKGSDGAEYAGQLLSTAINAPIEIEGSFTLQEHIVHELGSTVLSAAWAVLSAGNFVIQIDGRGVVHIKPKPTQPSFVIDNQTKGLLHNKISFTASTEEIPNRYIIIDDLGITVAENNDPDSVVSIPSRGYYVDLVDTSPTPINAETYAEYANRMLKSLSVLQEERDYSREYVPDVLPYDIIKATIDGLEGNMRITSQSLTCGNGIVVEEKVVKETPLYE